MRYGKVNEHNAQIPRDFWFESWEWDATPSGEAFVKTNGTKVYFRLGLNNHGHS